MSLKQETHQANFDVLIIAAFCWGLAEATFFFIVPDVLLTAITIVSVPRALRALVFSLLGATIGGVGEDLVMNKNNLVIFLCSNFAVYRIEARVNALLA